MINIHRTTKNDVIDRLPDIASFSRECLDAVCPIKLLVCTAGFEDRATALVSHLNGCRIETVLILRYPTNVSDNSRSLTMLRGITADHIVEITYDRADFRRRFRNLIEQIVSDDAASVLVDISVMSSYLMYQIFEGIVESRLSSNLAVFYSEADRYHPSKEEWQAVSDSAQRVEDPLKRANKFEGSGFQSLGIDAIYESEAFPGRNISALPTQVIAVPNFSRTRMREMLAYAENHYNASLDGTAWVIGQPPDTEKNGWRFEAMKELYETISNFVPIGTRDYKQMLWYLIDSWENLNIERHLVIATLGSKLQHLGIYLFLKIRPDTGLLLSEPRAFVASKFSVGVGPQWWIQFGSVAFLKKLLSSYGTLDFRWE